MPYTALLSVFGVICLKTPAWLALLALAANVFTAMTLVYLALLCDLWKPRLN